MVKEFLSENKIEYVDLNVAKDRQAAEEMVKKTNQMSVPVIMIEKNGKEDIVLGFDKEKIAEILEIG
jgi:glutaredoxin